MYLAFFLVVVLLVLAVSASPPTASTTLSRFLPSSWGGLLPQVVVLDSTLLAPLKDITSGFISYAPLGLGPPSFSGARLLPQLCNRTTPLPSLTIFLEEQRLLSIRYGLGAVVGLVFAYEVLRKIFSEGDATTTQKQVSWAHFVALVLLAAIPFPIDPTPYLAAVVLNVSLRSFLGAALLGKLVVGLTLQTAFFHSVFERFPNGGQQAFLCGYLWMPYTMGTDTVDPTVAQLGLGAIVLAACLQYVQWQRAKNGE